MPIETRLQKQRRGWFKDKEPKLHDLTNKFNEAEKKDGTLKMGALLALNKFGLLDESGDPVYDVSKYLMDDDFGYSNRKAKPIVRRSSMIPPIFGPSAGVSNGGVGDRLVGNTPDNYSGV